MDMVAERAASKSVELALVLEQGDINVRPPFSSLQALMTDSLFDS